MMTARMTRKPAPSSAASRRCAPFIPRHPPLVTLARRIVPRKPPSAPSRYKPDRTGASCHASTHPKDDDDGTALRHGLAADRGVRAADRLSCGHGVRALGLPREDRAPADLGGNPDVPDERSEEHTYETQSIMRTSTA